MDSKISIQASPSPSPSSSSTKRLLFDRRYGWVIDEWKDPSEEALAGGRGMFCILPLAKALIKNASQSVLVVFSNTLMAGAESSVVKVASITSSDVVNMQTTTTKLNESNYLFWAQAMKVALGARKKLRYILSDPPAQTSKEYEEWDYENCVVMSWLWNNMEPSINLAASSAVKVLERPDLLWPQVLQASLNDQVYKVKSAIQKPELNLSAFKGSLPLDASSYSSHLHVESNQSQTDRST